MSAKPKLKHGPHEARPDSGRHGGRTNRAKARRHLGNALDLMDHAAKHLLRARQRIIAEQEEYGDLD